MIDIVLLAGNIWTTLQPYVSIFATNTATEISMKVPEAVSNVWDAINAKFEFKPIAKEAIDDLLKSPEDLDTQASFRKELKKAMIDDESFSADLSRLLEATGDAFKAPYADVATIAQGSAVNDFWDDYSHEDASPGIGDMLGSTDEPSGPGGGRPG